MKGKKKENMKVACRMHRGEEGGREGGRREVGWQLLFSWTFFSRLE